jgi:hypothetical protein
MKAKTDKTHKPKKLKFKGNNSAAKLKPEVKADDGFAESKALSPEEIEALKEHLEDLNQQNTTGG